jgi:NTP pyrophosphatase (non-canonical NTP hydrolase)
MDYVEAIRAERQRQDAKWGQQHHPAAVWCAILMEEVGEVANAILDSRSTNLEDELIQVAAVSVAWLEAIGSFPKEQR